MNTEDGKEKLLDEILLDEKYDNILYAPDSFRSEELQAIEEAFKKGKDEFERAELARQALLEQYKKIGKLTKAGYHDLRKFCPVEYHGDESYNEYHL